MLSLPLVPVVLPGGMATNSPMLVAGPPPDEDWETQGYIIYWVVADEMHLLNLAVHPTHRRRGIARQLLDTA